MQTVTRPSRSPEEARVLDWRLSELRRAGFTADQASELAAAQDVDIRLAEQLLADGCPAATAFRILL